MSQFYSPLTDASVSTLKDHLSSRIHTHIANLSNFLTVLNASRHNAKIILHGIIQRYYQQNGSVSLVDIFGMLLGGTLLSRIQTITAAPAENNEREKYRRNKFEYSESIEENPDENQKGEETTTGTIHEDDGAEVKPRLLKKDEIKLSKQREYFEDGSLPMPIYCAVRHEIELANVTKAETIASKVAEGGEEGEKAQQESDQVEPDNETKEEQPPAECTDLYQWFEFTPYDMGSEEINGTS